MITQLIIYILAAIISGGLGLFFYIKYSKTNYTKIKHHSFIKILSIHGMSIGAILLIFALLTPFSLPHVLHTIISIIVISAAIILPSYFLWFPIIQAFASETNKQNKNQKSLEQLQSDHYDSERSLLVAESIQKIDNVLEELRNTLEIFRTLLSKGQENNVQSLNHLNIITPVNITEEVLKTADYQKSKEFIEQFVQNSSSFSEDISSEQTSQPSHHDANRDTLNFSNETANALQKDKGLSLKILEILDNLSKSFEIIIKDMKTQSMTLEYTFDAFDITTMSLERVEGVVKKASELAQLLTNSSTNGTESVRSTARGIQEISEASKQMATIIGSVQKVSEQTNVLAMNASIVAAKAGTQGRGFAVVAGEIRKLAQNSHEATNSIINIITDIDTKIERAVIQSQETEDIFVTIRDAIQETNALNEEVYQISRKNVSQGKEILTAVNQLKSIAKRIVDSSMNELTSIKEAAIISKDISNILEQLAILLIKSKESFTAGVHLIYENIEYLKELDDMLENQNLRHDHHGNSVSDMINHIDKTKTNTSESQNALASNDYLTQLAEHDENTTDEETEVEKPDAPGIETEANIDSEDKSEDDSGHNSVDKENTSQK